MQEIGGKLVSAGESCEQRWRGRSYMVLWEAFEIAVGSSLLFGPSLESCLGSLAEFAQLFAPCFEQKRGTRSRSNTDKLARLLAPVLEIW